MALRWQRSAGLFFLVAAVIAAPATAQHPVEVPSRGADYAEIKEWHARVLTPELSTEERLDIHRQLVRASPYGNRGLQQIFKNVEGENAFDPHIPGIEENLRLVASKNYSVRKGAARTHLYATEVANHPSFDLVEVNRRISTPEGNTDADLLLRHRATGELTRIEVKDWTENSQQSGLQKLMRQLDKMAAESRRDGVPRAFANRNAILAEVRQYGESKGIVMYEKVVTSRRELRPDELRCSEMLDNFDRKIRWASSTRILAAADGGVDIGFGVLMVAAGSSELYSDLTEACDPDRRTSDTLWRMGEHSLIVAGGAGMTLAGGIRGASTILPEIAANSRLMFVSKWGGRAGWAVALLVEGVEAARWFNGSITNRQFAMSSAMLGGGFAGGAAAGAGGAAAGGTVGGIIGGLIGGPPGAGLGAAIGAWVGGAGGAIGGGYLGATAAENAVNALFEKMDDEQQQKLLAFLVENYQSHAAGR